jgi:hypothetical protein
LQNKGRWVDALILSANSRCQGFQSACLEAMPQSFKAP